MILFVLSTAAAAQSPPQSVEPRIGILLPGSDQSRQPTVMRQAAELAINEANRTGGLAGAPFALVIRTDDGAWGTGSREITKLVFDDDVIGIVAAIDGRTAHVVQQVVAKGRIPFITPWASEPALSEAHLPWFFRTAPEDRQQSQVIVEEIFNRRGMKRIGVLQDDSFDGRTMALSFRQAVSLRGHQLQISDTVRPSGDDGTHVFREVAREQLDALVIFMEPSAAARAVRTLSDLGAETIVFASHHLHDPSFLSAALSSDLEIVLISPAGGQTPEAVAFGRDFHMANGEHPGLLAAYTYDSFTALISAIRRSGTNRWMVQELLLETNLDGVTGPIRFEPDGNRRPPIGMFSVHAGTTAPPR